MPTTAASTYESLRDATERRDAGMLASLFADDAIVLAYDKDHPPSRPMRHESRSAIEAMLRDVCSREMTHQVGDPVIGEDRFAFIERCEYPDGTKVVAETMCEMRDGMIVRQVLTQAWDA